MGLMERVGPLVPTIVEVSLKKTLVFRLLRSGIDFHHFYAFFIFFRKMTDLVVAIRLALEVGRALYRFQDRLRNDASRHKGLALELLMNLELYQWQADILAKGIEEKSFESCTEETRIDPLRKMFENDVRKLTEVKDIIERNVSKKSWKKRLVDALSQNERIALRNATIAIQESLKVMDSMIKMKSFDYDLKNRMADKVLLGDEAENFWIIQCGLLQETDIDIDLFTQHYGKFCEKVLGWEQDAMDHSTLKKIVAKTVDIGSLKDKITLPEFRSFCQTFGPLSKSFLKVRLRALRLDSDAL
jgi:hypothetical protein